MFEHAGHIFLFGGVQDALYLSDTWQWAGSRWNLLNPATSPKARAGFAIGSGGGYFPAVLSGGSGAQGNPADTWTWDGSTWTETMAGVPILGRGNMAFDASRGRTAYAVETELWEWDGARWDRHVSSTPYGAVRIPNYHAGEGQLLFLDYRATRDEFRVMEAPSTSERPGAIVTIDATTAGIERVSDLAIEIEASAGGSGNTVQVPGTGAPIDGVELSIWDFGSGAWSPVAVNTVSNNSIDHFGRVAATLTQEAAALAMSPDRKVFFKIEPRAGRGNGLPGSGLYLDYVELTLRYRAE
jgi:hypothetical protein